MFALGHARVKRRLPALVVACWGLINGPFLVVLAVRGESALFHRLWGGAVLVLELIAVPLLGGAAASGGARHDGAGAVRADGPRHRSVPARLRGCCARRREG
ncbi:hypothetical protein [Streptomyces collinus]|uniref:Uncharacterized protein n=1 Tax=Streptomyces collinus (strain DSM 40733 / Tue 365) TaxID=1214242 RepID=S5UL18_STRC3|nr:hypothetical protein [Streptomyces collinus]AGS67593.1 hypothetical protein B446_03805 [Streptomyces collinus Tu 365]UJA06275.1 hypothetical protein HGI10_01540 [Streptomyces collinus]UJA12555.1 hypothetical protein HGI10_65400 [Streptomyces collinus]